MVGTIPSAAHGQIDISIRDQQRPNQREADQEQQEDGETSPHFVECSLFILKEHHARSVNR